MTDVVVALTLKAAGADAAAAAVRAVTQETRDLATATTTATTAATGQKGATEALLARLQQQDAALTGLQSELAQTTTRMQAMATAQQTAAAQSTTFAAGMTRVGQSSASAAGATGNLVANFNDLGMMLMAGQNPLQLAVQQGTQITQVIGPMGAGGAVRALGAAFLGMLNPISLITIGGIAAGAAFIQWLTSAGDEAITLEDRLASLTDAVAAYRSAVEAAARVDLASDFGAQAEQARELLRIRREIAGVETQLALNAARGATIGAFGDLQGYDPEGLRQTFAELRALAAERERIADLMAQSNTTGSGLGLELEGVQIQIDALRSLTVNVEAMRDMFGLTADEAEELAIQVAAVGQAQGPAAQAEAARELTTWLAEATDNLEIASDEGRALYLSLLDVVLKGMEFAGLDLASPIAAANSSAAALAANLGVSLATAQAIMQMGGGQSRGVILDPRDPNYDPVAAEMERIRGDYGTTSPFDRRRAPRAPSGGATGASGASGGGGTDELASLVSRAREMLERLGLSAEGVAEKVRVGLMTTSEGADEMAQATERTAMQLADLIPEIAAMGPEGAAAATEFRTHLEQLAGEVRDVGTALRDELAGTVREDLVDAIATGEDAFAGFFDFIKRKAAEMAVDQWVMPMLNPLFDSIGGMFGSAQGNAIAGGRLVPYAKGGLPSINAFENQVLSSPTLFGMGGNVGLMAEAGRAEAIMPLEPGPGGLSVQAAMGGSVQLLPLTRMPNGDLGIDLAALQMPGLSAFAQGGVIGGSRMGATAGGGALNVNVWLNGEKAEGRVETREGPGGMSVDVMFDQIEARLASNTRRGTGTLGRAMAETYGLNRRGR